MKLLNPKWTTDYQELSGPGVELSNHRFGDTVLRQYQERFYVWIGPIKYHNNLHKVTMCTRTMIKLYCDTVSCDKYYAFCGRTALLCLPAEDVLCPVTLLRAFYAWGWMDGSDTHYRLLWLLSRWILPAISFLGDSCAPVMGLTWVSIPSSLFHSQQVISLSCLWVLNTRWQ